FFSDASTLPINEDVAMTASLDIVKAIAKSNEPEQALFALGYAGWSPGQLEAELANNGWLHCEADKHLLFGQSVDDKYTHALAKIGIDLSALSGDVGHA
ncbi:MAG: YqgE/AlgH family protein, partial [Parvibaculaceae bacterium]|nr:YqgE/AlgH family protein [Parvibaculaceae bacterium]